MIYLFTGSNGSGKTLNAIKFIVEQLNPDASRPVFYYSPASKPIGIQEAGVLDWEPLTKEQLIDWWDFPEGSIFLVDEFRTVWPYRTHREPVPKSVDLLSDHRDRGFDFILTAQKPTSQFDPAIQGFIEEHRHLEGVGGSAKSRHFVYQSFCSSPLNPPKLQQVERFTVPFDKQYFRYYRSASLHTTKNRLPYKRLFLLALLPLVFVFLLYFAWSALSNLTDTADISEVTDSSMLSQVISPLPGNTPTDWFESYKPRINGLPHTAPAYDELMTPQQAPKPAACVVFHATDHCQCYTQQATRLSVSDELCRSIVSDGWFDHSLEPAKTNKSRPSASGEASAPARRSPSVAFIRDSDQPIEPRTF